MYKPLEPPYRDFALATLVALLRYDVRMAQVQQVVEINFSSFLRSDVVVDALTNCMGASLDATRRKAIELYTVYVDELACFYTNGKKPAHLQKTPKLATREERETTVYVTSAENCLVAIENLIHKEMQLPLAERSKQRLTDRLQTEKARRRNEPVVLVPPPPIQFQQGEAAEADVEPRVAPHAALAEAAQEAVARAQEGPPLAEEDDEENLMPRAPTPVARPPTNRPPPVRPATTTTMRQRLAERIVQSQQNDNQEENRPTP